MDQERDTTDSSQSSRRGRFWREYGPTAPPGDTASPRDVQKPAHSLPPRPDEQQPRAPQSSGAADRLDRAEDALPILFELPDRTPEALERNRQSGQFTIHTPHAGPPASHVDPPSGNHSHLDFPGPTSPESSDSAAPNAFAAPDAPDQGPADASDERQTEERIAAYSNHSMSWAESSRASWATRSAIVMLVLMMVTLAFFSGRGLNRFGGGAGPNSLTDAEADKLGETVVMITDDYEVSYDDADRDELDPLPMAAAAPESTSLVDNANGGDESDFADSPSSAGSLGLPATTASVTEATESFAGAVGENSQSDIPPIIGSNEAVVAFRANESTDIGSPDATDNLPSGMDSRLRLEDGLRYSDTPHAIGNFLEILKAWEESLVQ